MTLSLEVQNDLLNLTWIDVFRLIQIHRYLDCYSGLEDYSSIHSTYYYSLLEYLLWIVQLDKQIYSYISELGIVINI